MKKKVQVHLGAKSVAFIIIAILLLTLDLITKSLAKTLAWNTIIIPDWIEINGMIPNNPGCAFSFLDEHPEIGQPIFITLTFVMVAVMTVLFVFLPEKYTAIKLAVAIVFAGAVGNLIDRIAFKSVRDFIGLNMFGNMTFCNVADFCIVIGAFIAVLDLLFFGRMAVFPLTQKARQYQREQELKNKEKLYIEIPDEDLLDVGDEEHIEVDVDIDEREDNE